MDRKRQTESAAETPTERVALNVLALCFALSVLGRGLGESFTVFLKPISESFGWDRAAGGLGLFADLARGRADGAAGRPAVRPLRPAHGLFARAAPARRRVPGRLAGADALAVPVEHRSLRRHRHRLDRQRAEFDPARPLVRPAAADRDGSRLFRDGRRRPGAAAGVADSDRPYRLARRLPALRHRRALPAGAACCCCRGGCSPTGSPHIARKADAEFVDGGWTLASAMRHHAFWALFSTFFFTAVGMYAISAQIVAYLIDAGFPPLQAATAWGFSGVVLLFGMLGVTQLDAHHRPPAVGAVQLRDLDRRHHPALAVAVLSELLAAHRLRRHASAA